MHKVAVLGAGYVVKPMIDYFLDKCKYEVVVATRTVSKAEKIIAGRDNGIALNWTAGQTALLEEIVKDVEVVIAMTPRSTHAEIAEMCIRH